MRSGPSDDKILFGIFIDKRGFPKIFNIQSRRIYDHVGVELAGIRREIRVTATDLITPSANESDFPSTTQDSCGRRFTGVVCKPDGVVKVIDDFLLQNFCDNIFYERRAKRGGFAVDEDAVEAIDVK